MYFMCIRKRVMNLSDVKRVGELRLCINPPEDEGIGSGEVMGTPGSEPGTGPRHVSGKRKFLCRFCGGRSCKYEDWTKNPDPAIKGLNCDYVTPYIVASQRMSTRLMREYQIIPQFRS